MTQRHLGAKPEWPPGSYTGGAGSGSAGLEGACGSGALAGAAGLVLRTTARLGLRAALAGADTHRHHAVFQLVAVSTAGTAGFDTPASAATAGVPAGTTAEAASAGSTGGST